MNTRQTRLKQLNNALKAAEQARKERDALAGAIRLTQTRLRDAASVLEIGKDTASTPGFLRASADRLDRVLALNDPYSSAAQQRLARSGVPGTPAATANPNRAR